MLQENSARYKLKRENYPEQIYWIFLFPRFVEQMGIYSNECDLPPLPSPATRSKPLYSPVKYMRPVRKLVHCLLKIFAQGYEPFRSTV